MADVLHETSEAERADGVRDPVHDQHVPDVPDADGTGHVRLEWKHYVMYWILHANNSYYKLQFTKVTYTCRENSWTFMLNSSLLPKMI